MPVFLIYSPDSTSDNATGRNSVLVCGADEAAARAAGAAACPDGETRVGDGWRALKLAGLPDYELSDLGAVIWLGTVVEPLRAARGA